jgi:hypothetical protein
MNNQNYNNNQMNQGDSVCFNKANEMNFFLSIYSILKIPTVHHQITIIWVGILSKKSILYFFIDQRWKWK